MKSLTFILCVAIGICAAVSLEKEIAETDVILDNPEEVPGLFEGDIDLQPGDNPFHKNVVGDKTHIWKRRIPYEIEATYPPTVQNIIRQSMTEITEKTRVNGHDCIRFIPRQAETAYMFFGTGTGCHSPVGNSHHRKIQVTLGHGCEAKGVIIHEIMHGLGFYHEQSRHDRDKFVTVHLDNVKPGKEGNFKKYEIPKIDELGQPYDYGSIMHYGMYSFSIDHSKPTIEPKHAGVTIGQRTEMSAIDIKEIQLLYGCIHNQGTNNGFVTAPPATTAAPPSGSVVCTFEHGLCDWHQDTSDQFNWIRHSGGTPSALTGPITDPTGSATASYLYVEASGHTHQVAKIHSKSYPGGEYCVNFYYHMYGSDMGTLKLNAITGNNHVHKLHLWSDGTNHRWHNFKVHANLHTSGTFKFEFEATIGSGFNSDIAIDDVTIYPGSC